MEIKLDIKDKKLIFELEKNSRQSNTQIAKKIGISKDAVIYRIKKLTDQKVIKGFNSITDYSKLGYNSHRILFKLIDMDSQKLEQLIKHLEKNEKVWWISKLDGAWDFVFAIWTENNIELKEFLDNLMLNFRTNIEREQICPVIKYELFSRAYLLNKKTTSKLFTINPNTTKEKLDETDLKILKELSENSRIQLIDLSEKLKTNNMTIHHRIKKLEERKIIQGYTIHLDTRKLKKVFYSVKINLKETKLKDKLKEYLTKLPQTIASTETIGGYDIDADFEVDSEEEYFQIIEKIKDLFSFIRNITYFRVLENYKILRIPSI